MNKLQQIKNTINLLSGKTANTLLQDFMVIASNKDKTAKLCFMDKSMQCEEDSEHAERRRNSRDHSVPLPSSVMKTMKKAMDKQTELEEMGLTDLSVRASEKVNRGGTVLHTFWIELPIDDKHKNNMRAVQIMLKRDKERSLTVDHSFTR